MEHSYGELEYFDQLVDNYLADLADKEWQRIHQFQSLIETTIDVDNPTGEDFDNRTN